MERLRQATVISKSWKNNIFATALVGLSSLTVVAQSFDTSATGTIKGAYFVRQILTTGLDVNTSAIARAVSLAGTMTFDGAGKYAFSGQITDSQAGTSAASYSVNGTYQVSASGLIQVTNPIDTTDIVFGGVGAIGPSAIVGSSTEGANNDIFIAIPAASSATTGTVTGTYNTGFIDFLGAKAGQVRDGYFTLTSNGTGSFGTVSVTGLMANQNSASTTQSLAGVTYSIANANGSGTVTFPTASAPLTTLVSGQKNLYVSADGNILLGGSPSGFDLVVGIKAASGSVANSSFQGTYYTAGLENDTSGLVSGNNSIDSFYGSVLGLGQGTGIYHERFFPFNTTAYDLTGALPENFSTGPVYNDNFSQNLLGINGQALLQIGTTNYYSFVINLQAKSASGTGVFISPTGILNAASYAPITNPVAPGQFVTIFGSGLATGVFAPASLPLPTQLGGVSVTVNGRLAPLSYVGPTQINILVPNATSEAFATFQVNNNNVKSNAVTLYTNFTAPGVFTSPTPASGIGTAAVLHANYAPVTQASPAKTGETVLLYLTGLGSTTPVVPDGAAAPSSGLAKTDETIFLDLFDQNNKDVNVTSVPFSGLAPGFAGLYQINFVIPAGLASGPCNLDINTMEAYTTESILYVQSTSAGAVAPAAERLIRPSAKRAGARTYRSGQRITRSAAQ